MNKALKAIKALQAPEAEEDFYLLTPEEQARAVQQDTEAQARREKQIKPGLSYEQQRGIASKANRPAWDKMAKATEAGEFVKNEFVERLRKRYDGRDLDVVELCDIIDRLEREALTTLGTNIRLKAEYNKLEEKLGKVIWQLK